MSVRTSYPQTGRLCGASSSRRLARVLFVCVLGEALNENGELERIRDLGSTMWFVLREAQCVR